MNNHEIFLQAIYAKTIVKVKINSKEKGIISRICIPFDYGISKKYQDNHPRYQFYDLDSPEGSHNLSILPFQLLEIALTNNNFDPADYVKWHPSWHIARDWGRYS